MKKVLGSLVLFGILATGSMTYAENLDLSPEDMNEECWAASRTGDTKTLVKCYKDAIKIYEKQGNYEDAYFYKSRLGDLYMKLKDYKNAEKCYLEALDGAKKIGNKGIEADTYMGLGDLYEKKGDKRKAKEYYTNAYNDYKATGDKIGVEDALREIKRLDKSK